MNPQRTIHVAVQSDDGKSMILTGRLQDPFHDIVVTAAIDRPSLSITWATGEMPRVPYGTKCQPSLGGLSALAGVELAAGLSRKLRAFLSGEMGCPHLVDLAEQICRFAQVMIKSGEARQLVTDGNYAGYLELRGQMGACAGHTLAHENELPQWLENEMRKHPDE